VRLLCSAALHWAVLVSLRWFSLWFSGHLGCSLSWRTGMLARGPLLGAVPGFYDEVGPLTKEVTMSSDRCPKHGTSYVLRRNVKTGEMAIACPLCDLEARGGSEEDRKLVADKIKSRDDPSQ
jgi:hypothetical protein